MTFKLIIILIFSCAGSSLNYQTDAKLKKYQQSLLTVDFSNADAVKTDVIYKLFRDATQKNAEILTEESVANANMNKTIPTVLIFHGWTTDDTSPWFDPIKDAYFKSGPHNIIFIDWSKAGNKSYSISSANILPVGKYIAQFLIASGIPQKNIHLVGHSLGSQLNGFIGKAMLQLTGVNLGRITALDPSAPFFDNPPADPSHRLCQDDADFVDVIHTDIKHYGFSSPMGHVDFYPNGGRNQPGCPSIDVDDNCSHARSTLFFIESINTRIEAREAIYEEKGDNVTVKVLEKGKKVIFGQHIDQSSRGVYYFVTKSKQPFLC